VKSVYVLAANGRKLDVKPEEVELVYLVFDLVYLDGASLAARPMRERHACLRAALRDAPADGIALEDGKTAIRGRIVLVLPDAPGPMVPGCEASALWSARGSGAREVLVRHCAWCQHARLLHPWLSPASGRSRYWHVAWCNFVIGG
jgi:hypothetical protein